LEFSARNAFGGRALPGTAGELSALPWTQSGGIWRGRGWKGKKLKERKRRVRLKIEL